MIICVIGTRPEAIKMAPVVLALKAAKIPCRLIATGQHMELVEDALKYFKLKPDVNFKLMRKAQHPVEFMSRAMSKLYTMFTKHPPTAVLAQGDTATVAATAITCFVMGIPFGHVEAGLRTHNLSNPWPEEWNRRIASIGTLWHFAPTDVAEANLRDEGVGGYIVNTGNTVVDALQYILKVKPVQLGLPHVPEREYILLTCHRRENFGAPMYQAFQTIAAYAMHHPETDIVYPVHPNPSVKEMAERMFHAIPNVKLVKPMAYTEFIQCLAKCRFVISDSGGVQEEAPSLGKRVVVLRETTERPESVDAGFCYLAGTDPAKIAAGIDWAISSYQLPNVISPYGDGRAASRIVNVLKQTLNLGSIE